MRISYRTLSLTMLILIVATASAQSSATHLRSPDGSIDVSLWMDHGVPSYSVSVSGVPTVLSSHFGLAPSWANDLTLTSPVRSSHRSTWHPLYGERDAIPDSDNSLAFTLTRPDKTTLKVEFRAYNEGIALRYGATAEIDVTADLTEFRFPAHTIGYQEHGGTEGEYSRADIANIASDCQTPLTLELPGGTYAAVLEAANVDFPVFYTGTKPKTQDTLQAQLSASAHLVTGEWTPWRVVMLAASPAQLLEHNYLQLNLNAPQAIHNTSYILPGTAMRETSLSTEGAKKLIDFAVQHGIRYIGFDDHWYGAEDVAHGDATHERTRNDHGAPLSIREVIAYGKQHSIGLFLYVDRRQLFKQRDVLFPLYEQWGVAGVKIGFVDVGTQDDTRWITETVRKAAQHHLMLDIHDQYRTTGYTRTYPNLLTVEGVRGNEHFPTSEHDVTLPFTRFLAGAADYTICYFDKRLHNTHAHQMAMSVVVYSPLQWLFWYDTPQSMHGEPELKWFTRLPTVWNETRVPMGEIGQYVVVARRRGSNWYIGALTNSQERTLHLPLTFLSAGKHFRATIYRDDSGAPTATHVSMQQQIVTKDTELNITMPANGGEAIYLEQKE